MRSGATAIAEMNWLTRPARAAEEKRATRRQANEPYVKNLVEANRCNLRDSSRGRMLQSRHTRLERRVRNQEFAADSSHPPQTNGVCVASA